MPHHKGEMETKRSSNQKCLMLILNGHIVILKESSHKWHEFMEEKPSLEMHKAHFRGKINLTLRVFDIVYFLFSVGANPQHFSCGIFAPTT